MAKGYSYAEAKDALKNRDEYSIRERNQIGDEGAKSFAGLLKTNKVNHLT